MAQQGLGEFDQLVLLAIVPARAKPAQCNPFVALPPFPLPSRFCSSVHHRCPTGFRTTPSRKKLLVLAFCRSAVPAFHRSTVPPFHRSTVPPFHRSTVPPFHRSTVPPFHRSTVPPFHRSTVPPLTHDQRRKRVHVLLQQHQKAHEPCEQQTMKEYETKDPPLVSFPAGRRTRDADALRIDHLAHHAARAVGRSHQHRTQPKPVRRDRLQTAEQHV